MPAIIHRLDKMIFELEIYCKQFYRTEDVLAELEAVSRLKRAVAILRG